MSNRPRTRIKGLDYEERTKTKSSDIVDQVIVTLSGSDSATYTRLANRYRKMKELEAQVKKEKDELNNLLKGKVDELFPEDDDVYTRVVDTASIVIKVGKAEKAKTIETFDAEGYIKEIESMFPELEEAFNTVKEKYKGIKKVAAKSPKLLTPKLKESATTNKFFNVFKQFLKLISAKTRKLLADVDYKIAELETKVDQDARA